MKLRAAGLMLPIFYAAILGATTAYAQYVNIPLEKHTSSLNPLSKRQVSNGTLELNAQASSYLATISIGSPGQNLQLILDTGSPLTWVNSNNVSLFTPGSTPTSAQAGSGAAICQTNACFEPSNSNTLTVLSNSTIFDIMYVDGTESVGRIVQDAMSFQGLSDTTFEFGLVEYFYSPGGVSSSLGGILGLSPPNPVLNFNNLTAALTSGSTSTSSATADYFVPQTIMDQLRNAGAISSSAFSLYLSDGTDGQLTIGGVDSGRYTGPLTVVPIIDDSTMVGQSYYVTLQNVGTGGDSSTRIRIQAPFVLDSGTTSTYLPSSVVQQIARNLNGTVIPYSTASGLLAIPCSQETTIDFYFANNALIRVPTTEILQRRLTPAQARRQGITSSGDVCILSLFGTTSSEVYLLGDSFLRSAYVVYDIQNGNIALAQSTYTGVSNITPMGSGQFGIPGGVYNTSSPGATNVAVIPSVTRTVTLASGAGVRTTVIGGTGTTRASTGTATSQSGAAVQLSPSGRSWWAGILFSALALVGFLVA